jgi:hypothetical protein
MRMILATTIGALALTAGVAGCASTTPNESYDTQLRQLEADCTARGGILTPTQQQTGRPQTDNACRITGGASRIPGN